GRPGPHVHDEHVDVTVVVEVAERRAPTRHPRGDAGTGRCADVFEPPAPQTAVDQTRLAVALPPALPLELGIDVAARLQPVQAPDRGEGAQTHAPVDNRR